MLPSSYSFRCRCDDRCHAGDQQVLAVRRAGYAETPSLRDLAPLLTALSMFTTCAGCADPLLWPEVPSQASRRIFQAPGYLQSERPSPQPPRSSTVQRPAQHRRLRPLLLCSLVPATLAASKQLRLCDPDWLQVSRAAEFTPATLVLF
jgi:hypothetical protein